ncbi:uncharacterized protein LOC114538577 [Dendronephthya gigantea]|uniref:uncharacterized protein LOC114538577 n=1 Tax=Dendronephthya gigantea TaxID=151771 RepID=UPI00106C07CB|nr:uncharacterized protein LOC114538577 [Dendronephthya gigantea]
MALRRRGKRQSTIASGDASADSIQLESVAERNGAKISMAQIDEKLTKLADITRADFVLSQSAQRNLPLLADIVSSFAPVIEELKTAYDAAQQQDDTELSEGELDENLPDQNATTNDNTVNNAASILASGLNESALNKRKEKIHRPANCNLLRVTKVNSKIWDVAQKSTHSMDARLQKLQKALVKGLTPIAQIAGLVGDSLGKTPGSTIAIPPEDLWESLFKADLDADYKAICSNKQPAGLELFGDDLAEHLKTVKESKKAAQQLTGQKRKWEESHSRGSSSSRQHFLFPPRGRRTAPEGSSSAHNIHQETNEQN